MCELIKLSWHSNTTVVFAERGGRVPRSQGCNSKLNVTLRSHHTAYKARRSAVTFPAHQRGRPPENNHRRDQLQLLTSTNKTSHAQSQRPYQTMHIQSRQARLYDANTALMARLQTIAARRPPRARDPPRRQSRPHPPLLAQVPVQRLRLLPARFAPDHHSRQA